MLHDKRDFRAIIFSCKKLDNPDSIEALLATKPALGEPKRVQMASQYRSIEAFRTRYFSRKCYVRTFDPAKRAEYARMEQEGHPFDYDIFLLLDRRTTPPLAFIGVPFSAMAVEVFGRIHQGRPDTSFQYHRPMLQELVEKLQTPAGAVKGLRTEAISWLIAGDSGRCDQITLRGKNVAHSVVFSWLNAAIKAQQPNAAATLASTSKDGVEELALTLRRLEVCYDDPGGRELLQLSFDRFGNYTVWVTDEGANLPMIFEVVDRLRKRRFLTGESKFPVRDRNDEPRL
jgi:hypothetical protein